MKELTNNEKVEAAKQMGLFLARNRFMISIATSEQDALSQVTNETDESGKLIYGEHAFPCYENGDYDDYAIVYGWPVH